MNGKKINKKKESESKAKTKKTLLIIMNGTGRTPVPPCLSPFSLSAVDHYADEIENAESCGVSLGLSQIADFVCNLRRRRRSRRLRLFYKTVDFHPSVLAFFKRVCYNIMRRRTVGKMSAESAQKRIRNRRFSTVAFKQSSAWNDVNRCVNGA